MEKEYNANDPYPIAAAAAAADEVECITDMASSVRAVEDLLNYRFKNKSLLEEALTHSSYTNAPNYQRLEFIGDAALGLAVSSFIYLTYPDVDQGQLTLLRSANTSTEKLARVAVRHRLYRYVRHSATPLYNKVRDFVIEVEQEDETVVYGGTMKAPKVLADIVESVAGAVYFDCDFNLKTLWMIFRSILEPIVMLDVLEVQPQPVTMLFEACQRKGKQVEFRHWRTGEKDICSVFVDGKFIASGSSEQRGNAKLHAAEAALQKLSYAKSSGRTPLDTCSQLNGANEVDGAKQKLHELCGKKRWPKPTYRVVKEVGPAHERKFICSVTFEVSEGILYVEGDEKSRVKEAENSAASTMLLGLKDEVSQMSSRLTSESRLYADKAKDLNRQGETYGTSDVPTDGTDASSQFDKRSSCPTSTGNSKHIDRTPSSNHPYQPHTNFTSGIRNSQLTPNSSHGNYPSSVKIQSWRPVEMAQEIKKKSLVNSVFTPSKSTMPTQYVFENKPSNKGELFAQTPHEKAGSTGRTENSGWKDLPSRSARSDPGNKHHIAAKSRGRSQWEKPLDKGEELRVSLLTPELTPSKSSATRAKGESSEKEKLLGQTSDEKVGSVGKSENSDSLSLEEKSFDICPEKPGNLVRLNAPLLMRNREKRNETKRSMEGRDIRIIRPGMILLKSYISISDQVNIVKTCRKLGLGSGGFYQPRYRDGAEIHLKMMCLGMNWDPNIGKYGNVRPIDGAKPPTIPNEFQQLVKAAIEESHGHLQKQKSTSKNVEAILPSMSPNICIVNFYSKSGRLGLHQDKDESEESLDRGLPVVSLSVGDSAEFLYGDDRDPEKAERVVLASGDVLLFGGKSRHVFHGVTNILADTAPKTLLESTNFRSPGRLNLTFRQS